MEALIESTPTSRLRRIDIDRWGSAVANQYRIDRLPTVWLYDGTKRVTTNASVVFQRLNELR